MKKLALTLTTATLALGMTALTASAQTQRPGAAALHAQAQNFTPMIQQAACGGYGPRCGPGWTSTVAQDPMAAPLWLPPLPVSAAIQQLLPQALHWIR